MNLWRELRKFFDPPVPPTVAVKPSVAPQRVRTASHPLANTAMAFKAARHEFDKKTDELLRELYLELGERNETNGKN